jgi:hypothetical protein
MTNFPSSPILVTLKMQALVSSKNLFLQKPHGIVSEESIASMFKVKRIIMLGTTLAVTKQLRFLQ